MCKLYNLPPTVGDSVPATKECFKKSHVDHDDDDKDLIMIAIGMINAGGVYLDS